MWSIYKGNELWHYSGGYWKYKNLIIYDKDLQYSFSDKDLEDAINEKIVFEYEIEPELYQRIVKEGDVKVVCSTTLKDEKTMEKIGLRSILRYSNYRN